MNFHPNNYQESGNPPVQIVKIPHNYLGSNTILRNGSNSYRPLPSNQNANQSVHISKFRPLQRTI